MIAAIVITVISCKKDGNGSLSIKISSVSSNFVPNQSDLQIILDFTDNGGHPIDSIFMQKIRINQLQTPTENDTFYLQSPSYNGSTKGQLQLDLDYNNFLVSAIQPPQHGNPPVDENDSLIIRFAAKDKANNKSDTVSTGLIIVERVN